MAKTVLKDRGSELYGLIADITDPDECFHFFQDVCSVTELRAIEQRFEVARLLHEGRVYTDIMETTRASSATISRVNRMLQYGTGALTAALERQKSEKADKADSNTNIDKD